ncbi:MAG: hypothetical protein AAB421_00225 [Patescibacteria group bacterium]
MTKKPSRSREERFSRTNVPPSLEVAHDRFADLGEDMLRIDGDLAAASTDLRDPTFPEHKKAELREWRTRAIRARSCIGRERKWLEEWLRQQVIGSNTTGPRAHVFLRRAHKILAELVQEDAVEFFPEEIRFIQDTGRILEIARAVS